MRLWVLAIGLAGLAGPAAAQSSPSYLTGVSDRSAYEAWFAGLQGEYKAGVEFWVSHRSIPKEASCFRMEMPAGSEWMHGCLVAQQRFAPLDAKRKSDPEYRLGWNSVLSPEVQEAVRARQGMPAGSASPPGPAVPTSETFSLACSQELSLAYQRGGVSSPAMASQIQEDCIRRRLQQASQAAEEAREANLRAQAARDLAEEQTRQREAQAAAERAQLVAEQSPDNNCRKPTFAGGLIDSFNDFEVFKTSGFKSIDIEHLTTVRWDTDTMDVICHGTFLLSNGGRITGTLEMKPNVAGHMISRWTRD